MKEMCLTAQILTLDLFNLCGETPNYDNRIAVKHKLIASRFDVFLPFIASREKPHVHNFNDVIGGLFDLVGNG